MVLPMLAAPELLLRMLRVPMLSLLVLRCMGLLLLQGWCCMASALLLLHGCWRPVELCGEAVLRPLP